ncbi:MAG TPA: tetratricopeptide repeat protein [Candidatus Binataceae bacterium]|nr:tetratricopeptide repeat protein [Candidatus Binataceae bacterium]
MQRPAGSEVSAPTAPGTPVRPASLYFTTFLGLLVAFGTLLSPVPHLLESSFGWAGISSKGSWALTESILKLAVGAVIVGIVVLVERRPLSSLGLRNPTWSDFGLGLALLLAIMIVEGVYTTVLRILFPRGMSNVAVEQLKFFLQMPLGLWLIAALAAGFVEEIVERGFALGRFAEISGSLALAAGVALALSVVAHVPFWGWRYAVLILPAELLFVLTYIWQRNIIPNIIAHTLMDSLPLAARFASLAAVALLGVTRVDVALGSLKYYQGDYKGAAEEYGRALEAKPHDPELLRYRADAESADRNYVAVLIDLDEILARNPKDVDTLIARSDAYLAMNNYDRAQADADRAVALAPQDAETYSMRAYVLDHRGKLDDAIADLGRAIKYSRAKRADLYYRRGFAEAEKDDYDHAIDDLNEALKLAPDDRDTIWKRAGAYRDKKQYDRAIEDLTRVIEIEPNNASAYDERGDIHGQRGEYRLELEDYRKAADLSPDNSVIANALAWILSTCPDDKLRDGKLALKYANQACNLSSWLEWQVIDTLAAAYAEAGNYSEAVVWEQRAIDMAKTASAQDQKDLRDRLDLFKQGKPFRDRKAPQ